MSAESVATVSSRSGMLTPQNEEDPAHIQDPRLRKKVQNRIAQRTYRQRMKSRIEALESFHEATSTKLAVLQTQSPAASPPAEPQRKYLATPSATSTIQARQLCYPNNAMNRSQCATSVACQVRTPPEHFPSPDGKSLDNPFGFNLNQQPLENTMLDPSMVTDVGNTVDYVNTSGLELPGFVDQFFQAQDISNEIQDCKTALHIAAERGKASTVQLLLAIHTDVLAQDATGRTALHLAVQNQHEAVIHELLKYAVCLEVQDWAGQTALHVAAANGCESGVKTLLAAGADLERKDSRGQTAFHLAAANGQDKILQLLFSRGADINAKMSF